jgi:O-antigen ligase
MMLWAHLTGQPFGGQARLGEGGSEMLATTRYELWKNALALIQADPWQGIGFGMFNMAWTLTPFAERSGELFDHAHNLPLHLAVELGLPAAILVMMLLSWALWQAARRAWQVVGDEGVAARAVFVMLPIIGLHSLLEYPLWYNYFLLPTAWAWGLSLRQPQDMTTRQLEQTRPRRGVVALGLAMLVGSLWLQRDYRSLATLYQPSDATLTQPQRIALGQISVVFHHFADYMAAINAEPPSQAIALFKTTAPVLMDPPLMEAWAKALNETGQTDLARYLAERLHEFHEPYSEKFFAPCKVTTQVSKPFQCEPAQQMHSWKEFLR